MNLDVQAAALIFVVAAAGLAWIGLRARAWVSTRRILEQFAPTAERPYILYFTSASCSTCRTHQEPALSRLEDVDVHRVDAIAEGELARRFDVMTVPTTVVISAAGRAVHVNHGYAPAERLRSQLLAAAG